MFQTTNQLWMKSEVEDVHIWRTWSKPNDAGEHTNSWQTGQKSSNILLIPVASGGPINLRYLWTVKCPPNSSRWSLSSHLSCPKTMLAETKTLQTNLGPHKIWKTITLLKYTVIYENITISPWFQVFRPNSLHISPPATHMTRARKFSRLASTTDSCRLASLGSLYPTDPNHSMIIREILCSALLVKSQSVFIHSSCFLV